MKYEKIVVITPVQSQDLVIASLFDAGIDEYEFFSQDECMNVQKIESSFDYVDWALATEKKDLLKRHGNMFFSTFFCSKKKLDALMLSLNSYGVSFSIEKKIVDDSSWLNEWKKYYSPFKIGKIWIVPVDENFSTNETKVVLEPGLSFGTGGHATTALILKNMQKFSFENKRVIDVGCGSGILGIAAAKLGAKNVHFVDNDERATLNAKTNCELSGVLDKATFETCCFSGGFDGRSDVVLANLTAGILISVACELFGELVANGILFASGIISGRENEVETRFVEAGFTVLEKEREDDWWQITFKKNS